jgi:hypothetical protein
MPSKSNPQAQGRTTHVVSPEIFKQVYDSPSSLPGKHRWVTKGPRKNNFTLAAWAMWRRHSCRPRPDSSGRLPGVLQSASRGVGTRQTESLRHVGS